MGKKQKWIRQKEQQTRQKKKRGANEKCDQNDSPEMPDRAEISESPASLGRTKTPEETQKHQKRHKNTHKNITSDTNTPRRDTKTPEETKKHKRHKNSLVFHRLVHQTTPWQLIQKQFPWQHCDDISPIGIDEFLKKQGSEECPDKHCKLTMLCAIVIFCGCVLELTSVTRSRTWWVFF